MTDPEPDRAEAAERPSKAWDTAAAVYPLVDKLDAILDALGCKNGHHDWEAEFTGDPPDTPNRRLTWSRDRLVCGDCGQTATLQFGERHPVQDEPAVRKLLTTGQIADALAAGFCGNTDVVQIRPLPARRLFTALRKALDLINAGDDPHAWLGSDEQHREWTVRQHSDEGALIDGPTQSRVHAGEKIAAFENWHDTGGRCPRPDFRLELVWRQVGPWMVERGESDSQRP